MSTHRRSAGQRAASPRRRARSRLAALCRGIALLGLAACAEDPPAADREQRSDPVASVPVRDTLTIEGRAEVVPVTPFESGPEFPLPFRTLVPDSGLTVRVEAPEADESGHGFDGAVRFEWQGGPQPAFLRLVVLERTMSDNDARGIVRGIGTDFGPTGSQGIEYDEAVSPPGHPWATLGYRLRGQVRGVAVDGWISLGRHAERPFYFMALYPPEYGDGLAPRFDYILRHWEWLDTGQPLYR